MKDPKKTECDPPDGAPAEPPSDDETLDFEPVAPGQRPPETSDPAQTLESTEIDEPPSPSDSPDQTIVARPDLLNPSMALGEGVVALDPTDHVGIPGYEIVGELGRGGMGVVYKARQKGLDRWVALKMVLAGAHADALRLARFNTEAQAVARLQHPNIVQIYDVGQHQGLPYFSLEFVDGGCLSEKVHRKAQPPREAAYMVETLARAMNYAHDLGIIHRDLKPANILLTANGIPKITDFGLAKRLEGDSSQTRAGTLMGTPSYMAPEQARGEIDKVGPLADVYALGAILYELLTGRPPFQAPTPMETIVQVTHDEPMPPSRFQPKIPRDLETVCLKCLQKETGKRYPSAGELAEDLRRFLADEPIKARPVTQVERLARWCQRNPSHAVLAGVVCLLLFAVLVGSIYFNVKLAQEKTATQQQKEIAEQNAVAEKLAHEEADRNARSAENNAAEARKAQAEASEQAGLALNTVYGVVTTTDEKLRATASMGKLRVELLKFAMQQLDKISKTVATSRTADRTMGVALQRMGTFYEQMGMTDQQIEVYERSLEIFKRLIKEQPEEDWNKFNAAISYNSLGEIGRETDPDPAKVMAYYRAALELNKVLAETPHGAEPSPFKRYRALASSYVKLGVLALELGDPAAAGEYGRQARLAGDASKKVDPSKVNDRWELLSATYFVLARASFLLDDETQARDHYANCIRLREEWRRADPGNVGAQQELGRSYLALGDLEIESGHLPASLKNCQKAHELFAALIAKDKENLELQWYLANVQYTLATAQRLEGSLVEAERNLRECLKTREALAKSDPKNIERKIEVMLAQARLGSHQEAAKTAASVRAFAPKHPGKLFSAARGYAVCAAAVKPNEKASLRQEYTDKAVETLRQALAAGFKSRKAIATSPDLEALRGAVAFEQLVSSLVSR